MKQDAIQLVSKCERCQKHSSLIHQPAEPLTTMLSPCPFRQWGIDIVGPFPLAAGQRKFLLVAVDYFTKWVEAEPLARITEGEVMKFIWKNIICRFGIPREIISDNGHQFQGRKIQEWCQGLRIKQRFTTVAHPQANGKLRSQIASWYKNQKKTGTSRRKLGKRTNQCPVGLQDNPRGSTGETPFSLVYGTEAIIPAELSMPSHRGFGATKGRRPEADRQLDPTWEGSYKVTSVLAKGLTSWKTQRVSPCLDHGTCTISRNTLRNKIPLKDHQVTGAAPLLRSSEGPSIHRGRDSQGPPPAQVL
ncbi:UNVERIFIED_CONTAM: hypothetical protein Slati_3747500 [Sesamum latifolium]|uniref:Integrase catalytic domain-containing protein n=1 Tax=Sesamum latifolium TaxID=2727402 RepID=A0AAW2U404_9LAMI